MLCPKAFVFMPSINHISAVYVTGIAGSGKILLSYTKQVETA
jgi:hypothetical protein